MMRVLKSVMEKKWLVLVSHRGLLLLLKVQKPTLNHAFMISVYTILACFFTAGGVVNGYRYSSQQPPPAAAPAAVRDDEGGGREYVEEEEESGEGESESEDSDEDGPHATLSG